MTMSSIGRHTTRLVRPTLDAPPSSHRVADDLPCTRKPTRRAQDFRQTDRSHSRTPARQSVMDAGAGEHRGAPLLYSDKVLTCADCSQDFVFTAREQEFYATRGFTEPRVA